LLPELVVKRQEIRDGAADAGWTEADGFVMHQERIYVPASSSLWPQLLDHAHDIGHEGIQKTLARLRSSFYCLQAARLVCDYIRGCLVCQRNKTEHLHPAGLL